MTSEEPQLEDGLKEIGEKLLHPSDDVAEVLQLLDRAESLLAKVEQSPPPTMSAALQPVMRALVSNDLFQHTDMDVRVAVASCVSEITRITAPEAPYDDEKMKGVFEMIVETFQGLDKISSRSFSKRVSVLETVAKVRLCVVMLDLECDELILKMFQHFLHTIRDEHPDNVFSLMEMIMRVVIEESEEVQSDVIYCLLASVKKDNKDVLPVARKLGEKVIANNAEKLKPYLLDAIKSKGTILSDYSGVVASTCTGSDIVFDKSEINASGQSSEDDSKHSERTVSEDLAQGSDEMDAEGRSSDLGTHEVKSPKSAVGNGNGLASSDLQAEKPDSSKNSDMTKTAPSNKTTKKSKLQKKNSSVVSADAADDMLIDIEKTTPKTSRRGKLHDNDIADLHNGNHSVECIETDEKEEKKNDDYLTKVSDIETSSVPLPVASESTPDNSRPKRGRPPGSKTSIKKTLTDTPASGRRKNTDADEGEADVKNAGASKKLADTDADKRLSKPAKKKSEMTNQEGQPSDTHMNNEIGKTSSDDESKPIKQVGKKGEKISESELERKESKGRSRAKKGSEKDETLMEMVSSPNSSRKNKGTKDQSSKEKEKPEIKNSEKWVPGSEDSKVWGDDLVGCSIKVWWPDDKEFYRGVVSNYNPKDKKHTVFYADGDVEVLLLKDERWRFVDENAPSEEEAEDKDEAIIPSPEQDEGPLKKQKSNTESRHQASSGKRSLNASKAKGDSAIKSNISSEAGSKSKGKSSGVSHRLLETPSSNSKDESAHSSKGSKLKEDVTRVGNDSNLETPKNTKKSKDSDLKSSSVKTEKGAEKSARKGKVSTPKSGGKASVNGNAVKGISSPSRAEEVDDVSAKASGNPRKRGRATKS